MSNFSIVKQQVKNYFELLSKTASLFYVTIDREAIWQAYLNGFDDPEERQGHDCNACKSFIRQWGGIVAIDSQGNRHSIWDIDTQDELYVKPVANLADYVNNLPITDVFLTEHSQCGTNTNFDAKHNVERNHFYVEVSPQYLNSSNIDAVRGQKRDDRNVLKRSLDEFTIDAVDTILDLIAQNGLYRGKEIENNVRQFQDLKLEYDKLTNEVLKENFSWLKAQTSTISRLRSTAAGTLLIDLSEGMDLDRALTRWEKVMAPTNYKRPITLASPAQIQAGKEKLAELGLTGSLERRFANEADLNIEDIIYVDKSSEVQDVFSEMTKETVVNPRTYSKVDTVTIEDFIEKVVPTSSSLEVLVENSHLPNFVSVLTSVDPEAPSLLKWDNPFSWAYTGGITDAIKERVKAAGGDVNGELRVSLSWSNYDDLDLHVVEPDGNEIFFSNCRKPSKSRTSGQLDVDMNAGSGTSRTPVENITWTSRKDMLDGNYTVYVKNYSKREMNDTGFTVQIESNGEISDFEYRNSPANGAKDRIVQFQFTKDGGLKFTGEVSTTLATKDKWGISTNKFAKIKQIFLSPNHWGRSTGNKHYMFILEDAVNDEAVRPFFNEFVKDDLTEHRKMFEMLGSKLKVEPTTNQLSGLGFSETQSNAVLVRVKGNFERVVKVVF